MTQRELTPAEREVLGRIDKRYIEAGGGDYPRTNAHHEFGQNFPEFVVNITRALPEQIDQHVRMLLNLDGWLSRRRGGPGGLHLYGPVGRGKTVLACLLANEAASMAGLTPSYVSCRDMRRDLRGLPSDRKRNHNDYVEAADPKDWPFLVLDDFGTEAGNPEARDLVRDIIDLRCQRSCYTVVTSNKDPKGFDRHLEDERDISRASFLAHMHFDGPKDHRAED